MKTPAPCEGIFVALVPQRGSALLELLREASRQLLADRDLQGWTIEFGQLQTPAGGVALRLTHPTEKLPWRDGKAFALAEQLSKAGPGRCWALALEKPGDGEGWAEGVAFDRGEQTDSEESTGVDAPAAITAWLGEQLALSENEVLALFEACDQQVELQEASAKGEDEIDQLLDRARKEFQRYRELKERRERSEGQGSGS